MYNDLVNTSLVLFIKFDSVLI